MDTPAAAAFGFDYPDRRNSDSLRRERASIVKQAGHLARLRADEPYRRKVLDLLRSRRARRADLVPFETIGNDGFDLLVVPGTVVIERSRADEAGVAELIKDFKLQPVRGLDTVVRLAPGGTDRLTGRAGDIA
ncbi:MAG: hypothetical protein L0H84_24065, partial [Pseudonocardia sp.]|nr:hypothetical protein [Pseudonocardia sp.]